MMSDDDKAFYNTPRFSVTTPPEDILEILVVELRRPIISIEGVAQVLSEVEWQEGHRELMRGIPKTTSKMKFLLDLVEIYVEERRRNQTETL